jgi:hypothetical protein
MSTMNLTFDQINKLTTKRLLAFIKRHRGYEMYSFTCWSDDDEEIGGDWIENNDVNWSIHDWNEHWLRLSNQIEFVKHILPTREHVDKRS